MHRYFNFRDATNFEIAWHQTWVCEKTRLPIQIYILCDSGKFIAAVVCFQQQRFAYYLAVKNTAKGEK